ncbi:hypothetical protein [Streptomyces mirabilis]|uniref:hypothetical protein n=1 Tax=Streptomyces mirabilis TaxID=68239 RepID=UPI00367ACE33
MIAAFFPFLLLRDFLPGISLFVMMAAVARLLRAGLLYLRSRGETGRVAAAKNRMVYGSASLLIAAVAGTVSWAFTRPGFVEIADGFLGGGLVIAAGAWVLNGNYVPKAVAAYSAWWMPKAERTAHRQDILYALTAAGQLRQAWGFWYWETRSEHAWGLLKSSPRAGLRARRYYACLAAAMIEGETADAVFAALDEPPPVD